MTRAIGKGFKAWIEFADYPRCGKRRDAVAQAQEEQTGILRVAGTTSYIA